MTLDQLGQFATLRDPGTCRIGPQALGRDPRNDARGEARGGPAAQQRPAGRRRRSRAGRQLFHDRCATCHRLQGEGETIGPDLTYANRRDRDFLLVSLVDPAGVVRKEYQAYNLATKDGRV